MPGNIFNSFEPITLKEMDKVRLMNRTDRKFCFHIDKLAGVLELIKSNYKILEVEQKRVSRYKTLYYDTADYALYKFHLNGKLNRYKIRHRTYVESDLGFLEVKFKSNKDRTLKGRIKNKEVQDQWDGETHRFIQSKSTIDSSMLIPSLWVNFSRLTFVNKTNAERLTIDINLNYVKNETTIGLDNLVIAEVKREKKSISPFIKIMKQLHIREGSLSKYVMGIALTCNVKKNNFKAQLKNISKITHDSLNTFTSH